jgi:two-component system, cell cycle response regulator
VLEQLKADHQWRDIPVIVISALDEMDSIVRGIELGAEDFLPKPFDPVLLQARLGACLEKKRLRDQEVEYLRQVTQLTNAAGIIETEAFDPEGLDLESVATREDALGQLARVFQRMAQEVYSREQRLKREVQELRIEIDRVKQAQQVNQITETDYFQHLRNRAQELRNRQQD